MPDPESKKSRRKRAGRLAVLVAVLLVAVLGYLHQNLTRVVRWTVQRALPGARVEIGRVRLESPRRLVVREFILRDCRTGDELFRLEAGSIVFTFDDLRRRQLGEIRLVNPCLQASPGLLSAFPSGKSGGALAWPVRRIVCDYAEVSLRGFSGASPEMEFKCSFDWRSPGDPSAPLDLMLWDLRAFAPGFPAPFLSLDIVRVQATPGGILNAREIASVEVEGGDLLLGAALQQIFSGPPTSSAPAGLAAAGKIGRLDIQGVRVRLEDTRDTATDISFLLNTTLRDISPSGAAAALGGEPQSVEIADLEILSPYDPFVKVLTMRRVFLRFTLGGLLRKELAEAVILGPSIYVGQDLFWYMEDAQNRLAGGAEAGPGWKIGTLKIESGRLLVGSGGRAKYGVPLNFHAAASDISLDNLATLKIQTAFQIPRQEYAFPDYQLEISTREGDLQFAYPPEKNENNLVGKVFLDAIRWRQFQGSDAWLSATFDKSGINGDFGGRFTDGYMSGGFSFLFVEGAPWIGWLAGERISLRQLTDVLAPKNFRMSGPLDFNLQMDAFGSNIERVKGSFRATKPGRMEIGKLDDLLANLPDSWSNLKRSSTRLALESLRDFDYDQADGDLWAVRGQGILGLKLQGPLGSRKFDIVLHADESDQGRWKDKP
ncbi:MAG: hypothetical protein WCS31_18360 [Verrucomicrobiae bacterium]